MIQQECNKFCATLESVKACPVRGIGVQDMAFQGLEAFKVQHNGKCFNLSHCFRVIKDEEKFKTQYFGLKSRAGKQAVEEVGDSEKDRPRGKTNSKKEDKRDAALISLIATVEVMSTNKDSWEEKRRQEREEQMNAFLEIQRKRLDMEAEKQARMLEMEAEKQAKMLEIEAANAKTKAKEVALTSMMTGVEIMKVDLNTVSPRGRGSRRCMPTCSSPMRSDLWERAPSFLDAGRCACMTTGAAMAWSNSSPILFVCWHVCQPAGECASMNCGAIF
ncbi:C2 domain-containing protein [Hordeum vulgare]|nr:C2 domain-containing protein [Hordeum vulgare]